MTKYHLSSRVIHWFMAALIIFLLALGVYMHEFLPKDATNRMEVYALHKSLGCVALIAVALRVINRLIFKAPALPNSFSKSERILAALGHIGLYLLMILAPVSGYLMSTAFGYPVFMFGFEMPKLIETNLELAAIFKTTHEITTYALIFLIIIHVLAVLKHRFFDKPENDVLKRML